MRIPPALGALFPALVLASAVALAAGPACAQVQQNNPNAANESFAIQSQFRSLNQQRTADFNTLNMQAQRNVQFAPSYQGYPGAYGPGFRSSRHHRAGGRAVRTGRGLDMGICTGC
jgi:hypothetical protein